MKTFKQYYNTRVQDQVVYGLIEAFGLHAAMNILHNTCTTMLLEAVDYTKPDPHAAHKPRDGKGNLIATLATRQNAIKNETDADTRATLQREFQLALKFAGRRYGITQDDVDNYQAGGGTSSSSGSDHSTGRNYTSWDTYDSKDNPYTKDDAKRDREEMDDWFDEFQRTQDLQGAESHGVTVPVFQTYDKIIRGYQGIRIPRPESKNKSGFFSNMDHMSHDLDQMAFENWVDEYKKSAKDWLTRRAPTDPEAVKRHIMTGEELKQTWLWFTANYKDSHGGVFNGHEKTHVRELPLAGARTDEWRNNQHTTPPPDPETENEPEPEQSSEDDPEAQPGGNRQTSDEESRILNDIHRMLKRGKGAGGRIRNYLPLTGVYSSQNGSEGYGEEQIAADTEILLDLVSMLRSLGKVMNK